MADVDLAFPRFEAREAEALADFLGGEPWPFHSGGGAERAQVLRRAAEGRYDDDSTRWFWIEAPVDWDDEAG